MSPGGKSAAASNPGWHAHAGPRGALEPLGGGVTAVPGVRAAGRAVGLRASGKPDLALVDCGEPVPVGLVQTRNQVAAAPVRVSAAHAADGRARAVLLNSGSANACTGEAGESLARASADWTADALEANAADVLVCSTGVIGVPIREDVLCAGVPTVAAALATDGGTDAAGAILTTDTVAKEAAVSVTDDEGRTGIVGGMGKGVGMLAPGLATMLAVVTTDVPLDAEAAQRVLDRAVARTFNRITVDGCMSTNDAVVLLARGGATDPPPEAVVADAVEHVCGDLAEQMVRDGEGVGHVVHLTVTGARTEEEAADVGRAVADSVLFRTAIAGGDPNWGRVVAAVGAGPVAIEPDRLSVRFGDVTVCEHGAAAAFDRAAAEAALSGADVTVEVGLGLGEARATLLTSDLTHEYVTINADYTT
ncbi:bifunctional glutamate N-acetyltransferase/amino-acid acetyltransferase ArgJ [Egibacter rhizosphaerae]|uniref:Arginine biosynthesis bifunctional protein ArgJ n=1 Tax=Egibacter rhizosphaerae TaxID=1670831 RepID=A0A411YK30_9ACTN|nr:bifunctional glutamate N-acetyltransferase/amino-acid acetyltransferase ArgJ [Egibacter rhizosphaerae]QBI21568.1 bifunctional glutamate N-acetyltransferase/amino-acid acetyltransferase ArgJ [Egibacter rhizosphaerae]